MFYFKNIVKFNTNSNFKTKSITVGGNQGRICKEQPIFRDVPRFFTLELDSEMQLDKQFLVPFPPLGVRHSHNPNDLIWDQMTREGNKNCGWAVVSLVWDLI